MDIKLLVLLHVPLVSEDVLGNDPFGARGLVGLDHFSEIALEFSIIGLELVDLALELSFEFVDGAGELFDLF